MAIPFACECGKKMTAKEEYAGRRLRCPECQKVVVIPKPAAAVAPAQVAPGKSGQFAASQPTLTKEEVAALMQTPAPTRTMPIPPPPRRSDLFAKPQVKPQAAAPLVAPVAAPVVNAAPPTPVATVTNEPVNAVHPWVDTSFSQVATPWLPGDEQRCQAGVAPAREWEWPIGWIVALAAVGGLAVWALTPP